MRAYYVKAEWEPKPGYKISKYEQETKCASRGNSIWRNISGSVVDRPVPEIKEDEVLLKIGAAGICGTDVHLLQKDEQGYSKYNGHTKYPIITGHEFSGEVVDIGSEVKTLKTGDLVSVESMNWCGECNACRLGMFNQCENLEEPGLTFDGGFAEFAAIKAKYCYPLNDIAELYNDKMAALELGAMVEPVGVAYNGLFVCGGGIRPGGHAVVFGAGPVGLAAISLLKTSGVAKLIVFETKKERIKLALDMGADYVFDPINEKNDIPEMLMDLTNGRGIALYAECSGATNSIYPIIENTLAIGGKAIQIGHMIGKTNIDLYPFQFKAAIISGSNGQSGQGIYRDVIALMANKRIDILKMAKSRFNLENIEEGIEEAGKGTVGKVLVSSSY